MNSIDEQHLETLSWAEARNSHITDSERAQTALVNTAVLVFAGRQSSWSDEAGESLLIGESPLVDGRDFSVTDLRKTRFVVTIRHSDEVAYDEVARDYAKVRSALELIVHGAQTDPTIADRLADAWGVKPWRCDVCQTPFAHWQDVCDHELQVHHLLREATRA